MSVDATKKSFSYNAWIALRFIVFGIGGFWLLMLSWVVLIEALSPHDSPLMNRYLALPLAAIGALMMLFGGGVWGRWAYLWVFLSTPLVISSLLLLPPALGNWGGDKGSGVLVFTLPMVVSYLVVRQYYRRRTACRETPPRENREMPS